MNFAKKSVLNVFGIGVLSAVNLLIGIVLARWLLPEGMGRYQVVVSAATVLSAIMTFGVGQASIYYINHKKVDASVVATAACKFGLAMGAVVFGVLLVALQFKSYFGDVALWAMFATAVYGTGAVLVTSLYPILVAFLEIKKYLLVKIIPRAILLALVAGAVFVELAGHADDVSGAAAESTPDAIVHGSGLLTVDLAWVYMAVGQVITAVVILVFLRAVIDFGKVMDWPVLKSLIRYGAKLNLSYVVSIMNGEIGILLIRTFCDDFAEIGYYGRAMRVAGLLLVVSGGMGPLLYSKWSSVDSKERRLQVERVSRIYWALLICVVVALEGLAATLIVSLFGREFLPAVPIMRILLVGVSVRFVVAPLFQVFSGGGRPLLTALVLTVNLTAMAALMVVLVPDLRGLGAAVAFSVSNGLGLVVAYYLSYRYFGIRPHRCLLLTWEDVRYTVRALRPGK